MPVMKPCKTDWTVITEEDAELLWRDEIRAMGLTEVNQRIKDVRNEIKKHKRPEALWVLYHKESMSLHAYKRWLMAGPRSRQQKVNRAPS